MKGKSDYYQDNFFNLRADHKKLWDNVNDLLNMKQQHGSVQEININSRHVTGEELAETMNRHFISVGKYNGQIQSPDYPIECNKLQDSIFFSPATFVGIDSIIDSLDNDAAAADDGIKSLPLKYTSNIISPVLTHILNRIMETGDFPDELKIAKGPPFTKEAEKPTLIIIGLFQVFPFCQKYLK